MIHFEYVLLQKKKNTKIFVPVPTDMGPENSSINIKTNMSSQKASPHQWLYVILQDVSFYQIKLSAAFPEIPKSGSCYYGNDSFLRYSQSCAVINFTSNQSCLKI